MAVEPRRGCGYRKAGGIYLVTDQGGAPCGRLPIPIGACPHCGAGIKPTRQVKMIETKILLAGLRPCETFDCLGCPLGTHNHHLLGERVGLQGVGEKFYTPESFTAEASRLGISRRVAQVPHGFKVGETWLFLAHRKVIPMPVPEDEHEVDADGNKVLWTFRPGIFHVCRPSRIEYVSDGTDPVREEAMRKRGFTIVRVPADDPDHH